jgi:AcrR family transcriptional regulator
MAAEAPPETTPAMPADGEKPGRSGRPPTREELQRLRDLAPGLPEQPELAASLRERKKLETRKNLSWAAIGLALQRGGIENVRTEEIAEVAGVSPRTFNNYFHSREEAIGAVAGDRARRVALAFADRAASEPFGTALAEAVVAEYTLGTEPEKASAHQLRCLMAQDGVRPHMLQAMTLFETELVPVIAERLGLDPAQDLLPKIVAAAVNGAIRVATEYWLREDVDASYTALLREAVSTAAALAEHPRTQSPSPPGASLPENANP